MPFEKGNAVPEGRRSRKGVPNKTNIATELINKDLWGSTSKWVLSDGLDRFKQEMMALRGRDYVVAYLSFLEYFKPRLKTIDATIQTDADVFKLIPLMPDDLRTELISFIENFSQASASTQGTGSETHDAEFHEVPET